jgi:uncharacterized membrane protein
MRLWLIPMIYVGGSVVCGLTLPRIEHTYFPNALAVDLSVSSSQAYLSAAASGMMALTGVIFAMAFVMVQFSAIAYSPRLVLWFARDHLLFHSLGMFAATFIYALFTLAWTDRGGSGAVPTLSGIMVAILLIVSMILFAILVQRLIDLQITRVLQLIGGKGRDVIRDMFRQLDERLAREWKGDAGSTGASVGPATQVVRYSGRPQAIAKLDINALVRLGKAYGAVIEMVAAVGDTVVEGSVILRVHGAKDTLAERDLMRPVRLGAERTFEQDPKYPIRLLVDIAIKALSPAINDPTTAVQAIDQIEDLLRRHSRHELDAGFAHDAEGKLRLIVPMPTWEDYLSLSFDEIRQFGTSSVQVMRRLRASLVGLADATTMPARVEAAQRYLAHLDRAIERSELDSEDKTTARQEDQQGLGLTRRRPEAPS